VNIFFSFEWITSKTKIGLFRSVHQIAVEPVHHCHVLAHEDVGMMQAIECTDNPADVNYHTRDKVASHAMSGKEVDAIYPKPSLELMYRQNLSFIDPNEIGYQVYPGFELEIPKLDE
jgi:hypothetical protein